ncbi:MAG: quinone-dependent dihydroorotate dehydrogenase [Spirosomataceae bacterium]
MSLYKKYIFPVLSKYDPEKIHYAAMDALTFTYCIPGAPFVLRTLFSVKDKRLEKTVFGITFPNPVGLAAGFDKNGVWTDELETLGFGFVEIGTVTPKPQLGNDKPRLFRLKPDEAVINRMGFNNEGSVRAAKALSRRNSSLIVGGNIGKNKLTENLDAVLDYLQAYHDLYDVVDYFVVNVSSPNTPGLRELQEKEPLIYILKRLMHENAQKAKPKPILLKIAPDLTDTQLDDIVDIVLETKIAGVIATNTTIARNGLCTPEEEVQKIGMGGLSGKPLKERSTQVIRYLAEKGQKKFAIVGVGGIYTADDALEKLEAGADLVQVYSGFIYEGPAIVKNICNGLLSKK